RESKTALVQLLVLGICVGLALVLCVFGCVFVIASAIVGLAHLFGISWLWTALMAAGAHFIIALALLLIARNRMTKPLFHETISELKEVREPRKKLRERGQQATADLRSADNVIEE